MLQSTTQLLLSESSVTATKNIWCCGCGAYVDARLTDGSETYPQDQIYVACHFGAAMLAGTSLDVTIKLRTVLDRLAVYQL